MTGGNGRYPGPQAHASEKERAAFEIPAEPAVPEEAKPVPTPAWANVAMLSLAVFAGPTLLAAVIGLVYLAAVVAGQTYGLFKIHAG